MQPAQRPAASRAFRVLLVAAILVWLGARPTIQMLVDWLWFDALGFVDVFTTQLAARVGLFGVTVVLAIGLVALNLRIAVRGGDIEWRRAALLFPELQLDPRQLRRLSRWVAALVIAGPALVLGGRVSGSWLAVLASINATSFAHADPVFGHDVGFYVFTLPVLDLVHSVALGLVVISLLPVTAFYVLRDLVVTEEVPALRPTARRHVLALLAALFVVVGYGWWLDRFALLFQQHGAVWGVGYADLNARLPAMWAMAGVSIAVAVAAIASFGRSDWRLPGTAVGIYFGASVLVAWLLPVMVQDYVVKPSELDLEREYLERNIAATREAFALDRIEVKPYEAVTGLTMDDVEANPLTIENVRVWDDLPLLTTYAQIQEIRLYYDFKDVDVDRYTIDGRQRQVMLAARELQYSSVPNQSWVNEHFQYTHGYGLTMSPVNIVTREGLPELFIKDIPPVSLPDIPIERPEIYYGESSDWYVFVKTGAQEFDYPLGDENAYTTYEGKGGVGIGPMWRRALFAAWFESFDILLSQYVLDECRVLFRRQIDERVRTIAPFLDYDRDPYMVVADGRLVWMIDAYTTTSRYPYSEPLRGTGGPHFNYMRNSVKVVVDAYDGDVHFYIADPSDPIVETYSAIFPTLFEPMSELPPSQASHVRYPVDFFDAQAQMYRAYHMIDPVVFYNREDMWELPREIFGNKEQPMQSYYLVMKLPGEADGEFILLLPFVPTGKDNMISWMAARCDPDHYGRLIVYQFPKQKLIYGPRQIESRIDQDPEISQEITLWSQSGSRVVRGNLLVIPIGDSLMYVEALYLQAESSQLPELKRVIVSYENRIAMERTLDAALRAVFLPGRDRTAEDSLPEDGDQAPRAAPEARAATDWATLAARAADQLDAAQAAQRAGDWSAYGDRLRDLEQTLDALRGMVGDRPAADAPLPGAAPEMPPAAPTATPLPTDAQAP